MWCASPLSILISINSRALSSASRCLLSSLTTPPLSLGQTPLFMILSNPWHRHLLVDRRYTLRRTRAATSRHTPAPRRAEGERLMGFLDRLFGRKEEPREQPLPPTSHGPSDEGHPPADADEQALQRYRYLLKTAPPETIEQAHEEAFAKLTPSQRAQALRELAAETPEGERAALAGGREDPKSLARLARRAEMRQPGTMGRLFGGTGRPSGTGRMMSGMGGMGGSIFTSLAAGFVGSVIAQEFLCSMGDFGFGEDDTSEESADSGTADNSGDDSGSGDYGSGGDYGGGDYGGGDYGGGDFGGGDFGGGDF